MNWIPCSEKMPETSEPVLVTVVRITELPEPPEVSFFSARCFWEQRSGERFWKPVDNRERITTNSWDNARVLAWMPLPAPYEEPK